MIKKILGFSKDELIRSSFILFIMVLLFNFFNYIFQISMAKLLGPSDYSILAVLMSIIYIFSIPGESIQTIITRYSSIFNVTKEKGKSKDLLLKSMRKGFLISLLIFILFVLTSLFLSGFLNIELSLLIITGFFIFLVFIVPVVRGLIQGSKKFVSLGFNMIIESLSKLTLSVILVFIGLKVYGAIIGVIIGSVLSIMMGFLPIRDIINSKREKMNSEGIYKSSIPIIVATLAIVLIYSIDIILARRFFSSEVAGQYAFVSLIAKVIIFFSSAIGKAMFPLSVESHTTKKDSSKLLIKSVLIVSLMSAISLIIYIMIPEFIVKIISLGSGEYLAASNVLFNLGLAYSLISISYIIVLYKLSKNSINKSAWALLIFLIVDFILLYTLNSNIYEYSLATLFSSLLIFLYSLFLIRK